MQLSCFGGILPSVSAKHFGNRARDWLGYCRKFHFICLKKSRVALTVCPGSLSMCTMKHRPGSFQAFGWMWAHNIVLNKFILLLLSTVISSVNTREPVPSAARHAHALTLVWDASDHKQMLQTLLFPAFWCMLIFALFVHRMLIQNSTGLFFMVWQTLTCPPCFWDLPLVYILWQTPMVVTLLKSSLER